MKVVLVSVLVALAAATSFAYGNHAVTTSAPAVAVQVTDRALSEPAALLLSGSFLLGLAGAVKRFTV
jgi:hypothetical protein